MRIIIAGILGGIAMFVWGAVAHMALPIGEMGVRAMPNEAAVISALKTNLSEPGFYIAPGMDMSGKATAEEQAAWAEKYAAGPTAIVVYQPTGSTPFSPKQFGVELGADILACIFAALAISWLVCNFFGRVATAGMFGLVGWLSINVSYWNWYRFPAAQVTAELIDQVVGWLVAGVVIALVVKSRNSRQF